MSNVVSLADYKASKKPVEKIPARRWVNVAYEDKEMAKRLHCRWDAKVKRWYLPDEVPIPVSVIQKELNECVRKKK